MTHMQVDTQREAPDPDKIEQYAHEWFLSDRACKVDINHDYQESGVKIVESYMTRDAEGNPLDWIVGALTDDPAIGEKVDSGELNAFSWGGPYHKSAFLAIVSHPLEASGTTEKSDHGPYPTHDHDVPSLKFNDSARVEPTETGWAWAHKHTIVGTTRTEPTDGHSHALLIQRQNAAENN